MALTPDRLSDLIGGIYDCVLDPTRWESVLEDIRVALGFDNAALAVHAMLPAPLRLSYIVGWRGPDLDYCAKEYGADVLELVGGPKGIAVHPIGEPFPPMDPAALARNRYFREVVEPLGLIDGNAIIVARDAGLFAMLNVGQHKSDGPIRESQFDGLRLLAPHLSRAATISRLLEMKAVEAQTFAAVVEALSAAVLLVDQDLGLVHANDPAHRLLAACDPVSLQNGKLHLALRASQSALEAAVAQAARNETELGSRSTAIPARRSDGEPMVVHILPLKHGEVRPNLSQRATAALFVVPAAAPPQMPRDALVLLYDLTPAEARVTELICEGLTVTEIGDRLGIAETTVKTHLKRIFDKTGCRRQVELVRLVSSLTLAI